MTRRLLETTCLGLLAACIGTVAWAQRCRHLQHEDAEKIFKARPYSPWAERNFPMRPLFGDTHLHTALSFDAGAAGARLGPKEAYRFAKGEQVISSTGQPAKLSRPLDFLVVTDHSDNMGFFGDFLAGKPEILKNPQAREWYDMMQSGKAAEAAFAIVTTFSQGKFPPEILYQPGNPAYRSTWQSIIDAAEEANEPGRFTRCHRLRVDIALQGQQPAPERDLP